MSKRGNYAKWTVEDLQLSLAAYRRGEKGLNQCSRDYGIPKATLLRHIRNSNKIAKGENKSLGRNPTFNNDIEKLLSEHIVQFSKRLFGLTTKDVRKLAYQLAEKNNIPHQFNKDQKIAGKKWYYKFMARHRNLSLRQPESTSLNRIKGFNKKNLYEFFELLENICDKHNINATTIFNVDESGFSTVARKCQKIVTTKGAKAVGSVASGERGVNTTIVCSVSAAGFYVPPMIIFKRKRYTAELSNGAPPGSKIEISDTGYINSELFVKWLQHFIYVVKPTKERKVVLLLDGHTTHCKNLDALLLARENGIIMLQLPGHTTHRLQPLDRSFFKPLEVYYTQALEKWLRCNVGRAVTQYQVAELLNEAYGRAATIENAVNGFKASGVWPVNRYIFKDSDFVAAEVLSADGTNTVPNKATDKIYESRELNSSDEFSDDDNVPLSLLTKVNAVRDRNCSTPPPVKMPFSSVSSVSSLSEVSISLGEIAPLPNAVTTEFMSQKRSRGTQKAAEITSTPYKNNLEESSRKKVKVQFKQKSQTVVQTQAREGWYCKECETEEELDMIQCMQCQTWLHCKCVGVGPGKKKFVCSSCI